MSPGFAPKWPHSPGNTMLFTRNRLSFSSPFTRLTRIVAKLRKRERERQELYRMTCRELRDIGLTRADIEHVFDPNLTFEFAERRKPPSERGNR